LGIKVKPFFGNKMYREKNIKIYREIKYT